MSTDLLATILGLLAFCVGVVALYKGWRWDPPRGRSRCPKCWYELNAAATLCTECGKKVRKPKRLTRTRRSRLCLAAGLLLAPAGALALVYSIAAARYDDPIAVAFRKAPERVVVDLAIMGLDPAEHELWYRSTRGLLSGRARIRLAFRSYDLTPESLPQHVRTRDTWPEGSIPSFEWDPPFTPGPWVSTMWQPSLELRRQDEQTLSRDSALWYLYVLKHASSPGPLKIPLALDVKADEFVRTVPFEISLTIVPESAFAFPARAAANPFSSFGFRLDLNDVDRQASLDLFGTRSANVPLQSAIAGHITLLDANGAVVLRLPFMLHTGVGRHVGGTEVTWLTQEQYEVLFAAAEAGGAGITVVVTGDRNVALHDYEATSYWDGEVRFPLSSQTYPKCETYIIRYK